MSTFQGQIGTGGYYPRPTPQPFIQPTPIQWNYGSTEADSLRFALELIEDLDDVDQIHKIVAKALKKK